MTMTDPISDLLTRIRNAIIAKHDRLEAPSSSLKLAVCRVLEEQGYIRGFRVHDTPPSKTLEIHLKYTSDGTPALRKIQRVSKPGRRVYKGARDLKPVLNGIGVSIVSTPEGLLTDSQARARSVGGEVLCQVY